MAERREEMSLKRRYMNEAARHKFLKKDEELELGRQMREHRDKIVRLLTRTNFMYRVMWDWSRILRVDARDDEGVPGAVNVPGVVDDSRKIGLDQLLDTAATAKLMEEIERENHAKAAAKFAELEAQRRPRDTAATATMLPGLFGTLTEFLPEPPPPPPLPEPPAPFKAKTAAEYNKFAAKLVHRMAEVYEDMVEVATDPATDAEQKHKLMREIRRSRMNRKIRLLVFQQRFIEDIVAAAAQTVETGIYLPSRSIGPLAAAFGIPEAAALRQLSELDSDFGWIGRIGEQLVDGWSRSDEADALAQSQGRSRRIDAGIETAELLRTNDELQERLRAYQKAKMQLVHANLLIVNLVLSKKFGGRQNDIDLIQEGNMGLMHAADKYDHRRGFKFSTYATHQVQKFIRMHIINTEHTIRLPGHVVTALKRMRAAAKRLHGVLGRGPSPAEIAKEAKMPVEEVERLLRIKEDSSSLDAPVGNDAEDGDATLGDLVADENAVDSFDVLVDADKAAAVTKLLAGLNDREAEVIRMRFGIGNRSDHTLEEVGEKFGVTRERIRQIELKAMQKLERRAKNDTTISADAFF